MPVPTDKLERPSVVEAVCEFRFSKGASYTIIPGAMSERLRGRFPDLELLPTATLMGGIPDEVMIPPVPHHRFKSRDPNALVQTGPRLLTVNILPRYPSFEVFRELILYVLGEYRTVAAPGNPIRVSLRYINQIGSARDGREVSDYLKFSISYPKGLPHPPQELAARVSLPYGDLGTLGFAVGFPSRVSGGEAGALLDLELSWTQPVEFNLDRFPDWLDEAHGIIYGVFTQTVAEQIMIAMRGKQS